MPVVTTRVANPSDADAIARIYNEGIEDRIATFETRLRSAEDIVKWFDGVHPVVVAEAEQEIVAFAATSLYRPRACYAGVAELSIYVTRPWRSKGVGTAIMHAIVDVARQAGYWKLLSRVFPENEGSRTLLRRTGFREVGVYEKHGKLDETWRDVVIVERVIV